MSIDIVQDISPSVQYVASAGQTDFDYTFPIFSAEDLAVIVNNVTRTDFTVNLAGVGNDTGGPMSFTSGLTAGDIVTLYRDTPIDRLTDAQFGGPNSSAAFNDELDRIILMIQEEKARSVRSLKFSVTDGFTDADTTIIGANNKNKVLLTDSSGKPYFGNPTDLISVAAFGTAVADQFTATAGQTVFNLTQNPGIIANLDLSIDGSVMVPLVDFNLTGAQLTLVNGALVGQKVFARYMQALPVTFSGVLSGAGSPAGVVVAPVGSLYLRSDGGAGTTLYVKESGVGNTGWVAK